VRPKDGGQNQHLRHWTAGRKKLAQPSQYQQAMIGPVTKESTRLVRLARAEYLGREVRERDLEGTLQHRDFLRAPF
jgi:hypothetical protein